MSSSPWNIYDVIAEFMELQNIPKGPIVLRDWDIGLARILGIDTISITRAWRSATSLGSILRCRSYSSATAASMILRSTAR